VAQGEEPEARERCGHSAAMTASIGPAIKGLHVGPGHPRGGSMLARTPPKEETTEEEMKNGHYISHFIKWNHDHVARTRQGQQALGAGELGIDPGLRRRGSSEPARAHRFLPSRGLGNLRDDLVD